MKRLTYFVLTATLTLICATPAYPKMLGGVAPLAQNRGPLITPIDVGPSSVRALPVLADNTRPQDPEFRSKLDKAVNAIVWTLFDQHVITSHNVRGFSPSLDTAGNVIALSISGDKFLANGPVVSTGDTRIFKASVTAFR